jgi:hypothetical protein
MSLEKMPPAHQNPQYKCGQCRWLYVGYDGVTCQQKRGVTLQTQACIEFDPYRPSTFDKVCRDKLLVELQKRVAVPKEEYIQKIADELKTFKISMKPKSHDFSQYTVVKDLLVISHNFEKCSSYMDRVVEIRSELMTYQDGLAAIMKEAQGYIFSNYTDQLRALKNDSERGAFYQGVLPTLFKAIDQIDGLVRKTELVQANLTNQHFSLKEMQAGVMKVWDYRMNSLDSRKLSRG